MNQIYQQVWISLDKEIRNLLAKDLKIMRTGITEIRDQVVISDGFTNDDLKQITLEKMCEYIGSQETFSRAWELTIAKAKSILNPPIGVIKSHHIAKIEIEDDLIIDEPIYDHKKTTKSK